MAITREKLVLETLGKASDLIREAVQVALPENGSPEEAVRLVRALMLRALMPKIAAQEFLRLGGTDSSVFGLLTAERNLGWAADGLLGWVWVMDAVDSYGGLIPLAFSREQAEEMHKRLSEALGK